MFFPNTDTYLQQDNIQRIMSIATEEDYEEAFPIRNSSLTYNELLFAAAHYPQFCDYQPIDKVVDEARAEAYCRKELATLMAHIATDTNRNNDCYQSYITCRPPWK